jgi:DHA1 family multidrug resistance protein-like MFS transporter
MSETLLQRPRTWLARWRAILPLLAAELVVWLGFGALLPVLPLYFRDHGVDLAMMGVVVAAWPAARLVAEPAFGWLADRTRRVPLMLAGLVVFAIATFLPLILVGPLAFLLLRALAGLATAAYDPSARGYLVDAVPVERRAEAFGIYGAAQMGGLLLGPAVGALGAGIVGGYSFVFVFSALASLVAAIGVGLFVPELRSAGPSVHPPAAGIAGLPIDEPVLSEAAGRGLAEPLEPPADAARRPRTLRNRLLVATLVIQFGSLYATGVYEVMWSLFLEARGAGLDLIGLTFMMFGIPILVLSPYAGRLADRRGTVGFVVLGSLVASVAGVLYTIVPEIWMVVPIILLESAGIAFLGPALFAIVAAGSPLGRSSTAQGIFGAAGTLGTIVAALSAGVLAEVDLRLPFWVFSAVVLVTLAAGLLIGGRRMAALQPGSGDPTGPRAPADEPPAAVPEAVP